MNKKKLTIIIIGLVDILGIGIFIPTMPDLAHYYGVSAHSISYAIVLFAFFSFLFGPILGQLSDKFGRKKILLLCIIGSFISSFIMSISELFWVFLLGRIINGISGGNISIIQSMMNDISKSKEERIHNMGILGGLFGMGFIIGPIIGSLLLPLGVKAPFWFMTGLSIIEIFMIIFFLKETNHYINHIKQIDINPFYTITKYIKNKEVSLFFISFFILILSFSMYQGMFTVFLNKNFGMSGEYSGYVMSGVGLGIAINQVFLLKRFWMRYFSLKKLFIITNFGIFIIFSFLSVINHLPSFLIIFYCLVFFQGVVNPIYQSEIVETAHISNRGEIMGVLGSLQSMSMFIGPLISGILIDKNISIFFFSTIIVFLNILFLPKLLKMIQ